MISTILLIVFAVAMVGLTLWWAFNTIRRIELQQNYAAITLTSVVKLWRKAKIIPEGAKDRESLYLYDDFINHFEEAGCPYPIMVKNGGIRCVTRKEYDQQAHLHALKPFSILLIVLSALYAMVAIILNMKTLVLGIVFALIMPTLLVVIGILISRFNHDKDKFRDRLFHELKENSVDFLRITKPFLMMDAYPQAFGRTTTPRFTVVGEISDEQLAETKDFIIRQKKAEKKVYMEGVDNRAEIARIKNPTPIPEPAPVPPAPAPVATPPTPVADPIPPVAVPQTPPAVTTTNNATQPLPTAPEATPASDAVSADLDPLAVFNQLVNDSFAVEAAAAAATQPDVDTKAVLNQLPDENVAEEKATDTTAEPPAPAEPLPEPPAADDFSLDAIGLAIDSELAKRQASKTAANTATAKKPGLGGLFNKIKKH